MWRKLDESSFFLLRIPKRAANVTLDLEKWRDSLVNKLSSFMWQEIWVRRSNLVWDFIPYTHIQTMKRRKTLPTKKSVSVCVWRSLMETPKDRNGAKLIAQSDSRSKLFEYIWHPVWKKTHAPTHTGNRLGRENFKKLGKRLKQESVAHLIGRWKGIVGIFVCLFSFYLRYLKKCMKRQKNIFIAQALKNRTSSCK